MLDASEQQRPAGPTEAVADGALDRLLGPGHGQALVRCWDRRHLHIAGREPARFRPLFSRRVLDEILATSAFPARFAETFRCVAGRTVIEPFPTRGVTRRRQDGPRADERFDLDALVARLRAGHTLRLRNLNLIHRPLRALGRALTGTLGVRVGINAYYSPPSSQGLQLHWDTHGILICQVEGDKTFELFEPMIERPLPSQPSCEHDYRPGEPIAVIRLRAGDCLYMPRGLGHLARATEHSSLHLSVGFHPPSRLDVFCDTVIDASAQLAEQPWMRQEHAAPDRSFMDDALAEVAAAVRAAPLRDDSAALAAEDARAGLDLTLRPQDQQ